MLPLASAYHPRSPSSGDGRVERPDEQWEGSEWKAHLRPGPLPSSEVRARPPGSPLSTPLPRAERGGVSSLSPADGSGSVSAPCGGSAVGARVPTAPLPSGGATSQQSEDQPWQEHWAIPAPFNPRLAARKKKERLMPGKRHQSGQGDRNTYANLLIPGDGPGFRATSAAEWYFFIKGAGGGGGSDKSLSSPPVTGDRLPRDTRTARLQRSGRLELSSSSATLL